MVEFLAVQGLKDTQLTAFLLAVNIIAFYALKGHELLLAGMLLVNLFGTMITIMWMILYVLIKSEFGEEKNNGNDRSGKNEEAAAV